MGVNKIMLNDELLLDLTGDTVTPADVRAGVIFHGADGEIYEGTAEVSDAGELPEGYYAAPYVESDGTSYVDTGIKPTNKTRITVNLAFFGSVGTNILGVRDSASETTNRFGLITFSSSSKIGAFFGTSSITAIAYDNELHSYDLDGGILSVDGVKYGSAYTGTFSCSYPIALFGFANGAEVTKVSERIYGCKIYEGGVLVRNYVPAYHEAGNQYGLYDMVGGTFSAVAAESTASYLTGTMTISATATNVSLQTGVTLKDSDIFIMLPAVSTSAVTTTDNYQMACILRESSSSVKFGYAYNGLRYVNNSYYSISYSGTYIHISSSYNIPAITWRWVLLR